ncbi:MAG: hypothetical protein J7L44_00325 [Candidatus Diapherotrites archaeon]|nr:hypothetical protein [Candidatus Diapherotrites archaeon]
MEKAVNANLIPSLLAILLILNCAHAGDGIHSHISPESCDWTKMNVPFSITCMVGTHAEGEHAHKFCPEGTKTYYAIVEADAKCPKSGFTEAAAGEVTCEEGSICIKKVCFYSKSADMEESIKESGEFKIDKTKPKVQISISLEESNGRRFTVISASCNDTGSGCDTLKYKTCKTSRWIQYTGTIKVENIEKIFFKATDRAGNETLIEKSLNIESDADNPTKPGALNVSFENGSVVLQWEESTDESSGVLGYKIFRVANHTIEEIGFTQETSFKDTQIPSGPITYRVVAVDFAGNYSEASEASLNFSTEIELTELSHKSGWYREPFKVLLKCVYAKGCSKTFFRINGGKWQEGSEIEIKQQGKHAIEFYSLGRDNTVEQVREAWFGLDTEAPKVSSLILTLDSKGVKLRWNCPPDRQSGLAKFIIYKNGALLAETTEKSFLDSAIQPGRTYEYSIVAIDLAGNESTPIKKVIEMAPGPSIWPYLLIIFLIFIIVGFAIIIIRKMKHPYRA